MWDPENRKKKAGLTQGNITFLTVRGEREKVATTLTWFRVERQVSITKQKLYKEERRLKFKKTEKDLKQSLQSVEDQVA